MTAGYDAELFDATTAVDATHFWYRARAEVIAAALAHVAPRRRVLDLGCGTGPVTAVLRHAFPHATVAGSDPFIEAVTVAARRTGVPTIQADVAHIPAHALDLIGTFDVLEHIEDDAAALAEIRRALSADGAVVATVPAGPKLWSDFDVASGHYRRYDAATLRRRFEDAGFEVRYMTHFMTLLQPVARLRRRGGDVSAELEAGRTANAVLYRVLRQEARAVRRHWTLPFGTSLLIEAHVR